MWNSGKTQGNAMTAPFDLAPLLAPGTPAPAVKWNGFPKYNFIGMGTIGDDSWHYNTMEFTDQVHSRTIIHAYRTGS